MLHLEEFEGIADVNVKARCETHALDVACALLTAPETVPDVGALVQLMRDTLPAAVAAETRR
jgi:hypothetical protein